MKLSEYNTVLRTMFKQKIIAYCFLEKKNSWDHIANFLKILENQATI